MVYVDKEGENILICADADLQEALFEHRDDTVPLTLKLLPRKSKKVALQCEVHVYMDGEGKLSESTCQVHVPVTHIPHPSLCHRYIAPCFS